MVRLAPILVVLTVLVSVGSGVAPALVPHGGGSPGVVADPGDTAIEASDLVSDTRYWRGMTLRFDGSEVVENISSATPENRTFQLWEVDDAGETVDVVSSFTVDHSGIHELETDTLAGRYVIQYDGEPVYVVDGIGYLSETPSGETVTVEASTWRIDRQQLSASWIDPHVYEAQTATLEVSSNRDRYVIAVSGDGLTFDDLTSLFANEDYAATADAHRDDDELLLRGGSASTFRINGSVLEPDGYTFEFDVIDTTASTTARLTVKRPDSGPSLHSVQTDGTVGDLVTAHVSCSACYVVVGGPREGMLDLLALTDETGDGMVDLTINTRYVGLHPGSAIPSSASAYDAGDDDVYRYDTSDQFDDRTLHRDTAYIGMVREALGLESSGRTSVLGPGDLTIHVSPTDYVISRERYGENRPPPSGELVLPDENDAATIVLEDRSLSGIDVAAAPRSVGERQEPATVIDRSSPVDEVAVGDQLVVGVDISGVFGYLAGTEATMDVVLDNEEEGLDLEIVPNAGGSPIRIGVASRLVVDRENERLWVVIDTDTLDDERSIDRGTPYTIRFRLRGSGPTVTGDGGEAVDGYPYLSDGVIDTATTSVTFATPRIEITSPSSTELSPTTDLTVAGTTTLAPGSTVMLRATAHDPYVWSTTTSAVVEEGGTWQVDIEFDAASGNHFTLSTTYLGTRMDETEIRFVNETDSTSTASENGTPVDGQSANGTPVGTAHDETTPVTDGPTPTEASPETPVGTTTTEAQSPSTDGTQTPDAGASIPGLSLVTGLPFGQIGGGIGLLFGLFVGLRIFRGLR